MRLEEARARLRVLQDLPAPRDRRLREHASGPVPTPLYAVWEITLACDQRCVHCGSRAGKARKDELTTQECLDVARQLGELGVGEVTLIGGEAYLRNDFILIVGELRAHGMSVTMTTGGLNLTQARVDALKDAGIRSISISLDGLAQAHDELRGVPGSHDKALEALARVRAAGIPVAVNTQINRRTLPDLPALLERIAEAGAFGWQLQITSPFGNAADRPDILLQPYMMLEVYDVLRDVLQRARALRMKMWPGNNLGYFGPLEAELRSVQKRHYKGCAAGRLQLGIEAHGDVKGCPSLGGPENVGGNVREHRIADIWARAAELAYVRERTTDALWGYCAQCYYADTCRGGCTATAEPLMGRPGNNPFCHHRALEMDRLGQRERIEQVAAAPGVPFDHGLYRIVREWVDPRRREAEGPVAIDEPRVSRVHEPTGAGRAVDSDSRR
ncbi:MAG: radical SAM protein [Nannocystaceae bacterium]|nr:radical SAM protein [bacterium]